MDLDFLCREHESISREAAWQAAHRLASRLRAQLLGAGFDCDELCAVGASWGFLIEPMRA